MRHLTNCRRRERHRSKSETHNGGRQTAPMYNYLALFCQSDTNERKGVVLSTDMERNRRDEMANIFLKYDTEIESCRWTISAVVYSLCSLVHSVYSLVHSIMPLCIPFTSNTRSFSRSFGWIRMWPYSPWEFLNSWNIVLLIALYSCIRVNCTILHPLSVRWKQTSFAILFAFLLHKFLMSSGCIDAAYTYAA